MPLKSDLRDRMLGYTEELRVIGGKIMSVVPSLATIGIIMLAVYVNFNIQTYFTCLLLLLLSLFSRVRLCAIPWTAPYQASPSMGFSRQEHWSGLPLAT